MVGLILFGYTNSSTNTELFKSWMLSYMCYSLVKVATPNTDILFPICLDIVVYFLIDILESASLYQKTKKDMLQFY